VIRTRYMDASAAYFLPGACVGWYSFIEDEDGATVSEWFGPFGSEREAVEAAEGSS